MRILILLSAERSDICLDSTGTKTDSNHRRNKSTKTSIVHDGRGRRCRNENNETQDVDDACAEDGFELAEILIYRQ